MGAKAARPASGVVPGSARHSRRITQSANAVRPAKPTAKTAKGAPVGTKRVGATAARQTPIRAPVSRHLASVRCPAPGRNRAAAVPWAYMTIER